MPKKTESQVEDLMRKAIVVAMLAVMALGSFWLLFSPVPIEPAGWRPGEDPAGAAPWLPSGSLGAARLVPTGPGPESILIGPRGGIFTGLQDGRIARYAPDGSVTAIADTGGRPLGLKFDANGRLVVADAVRGLLTVSSSGTVSVLADSVAGERMLAAEEVAVARDGAIWLTDGSQRFGNEDRLTDAWEGRPTGRLLYWSPVTRKARVVLEGLAFANGLAFSPDEDFVLVTESDRYRIRRLWLKGEKSGTSDFFVDNLPGHPDGLSAVEDGYWVAFAAPRMPFVDWLAPRPFLRKALYRLFLLLEPSHATVVDEELIRGSLFHRIFVEWLGTRASSTGWVAKLDAQGNVVRSLADPTGKVRKTSSVVEHSGKLYVGSYSTSAIAILRSSAVRGAARTAPGPAQGRNPARNAGPPSGRRAAAAGSGRADGPVAGSAGRRIVSSRDGDAAGRLPAAAGGAMAAAPGTGGKCACGCPARCSGTERGAAP